MRSVLDELLPEQASARRPSAPSASRSNATTVQDRAPSAEVSMAPGDTTVPADQQGPTTRLQSALIARQFGMSCERDPPMALNLTKALKWAAQRRSLEIESINIAHRPL